MELLTLICTKQKTKDLAGNYIFKVNNRNTRTKRKICSKLTIETPEQRHWRCSGVFIVNFEHFTLFASISIVKFEQANADWKGVKI